MGDGPIELAAQKAAWTAVKAHHISEVVKAVRRNAPQIQPDKLNDPARQIVIFKNGVFDLNTGQLSKHSHQHLHTIGIPHTLNPEAECPEFDQFVSEVLPQETHALLRQIMGYLLIPVHRV